MRGKMKRELTDLIPIKGFLKTSDKVGFGVMIRSVRYDNNTLNLSKYIKEDMKDMAYLGLIGAWNLLPIGIALGVYELIKNIN